MQTLEMFSAGPHSLEKFYLSFMTHDQLPVVLEDLTFPAAVR